MKKISIRILLMLLAIILGYLVFNKIDARPYQSSLNSLPALAPDAFENSNGYYRLWTLIEPKNVDIETDAAILPYRRLFDPAFDNDRYIKEFSIEAYIGKYKKQKELAPIFSAMTYGADWVQIANQYEEQLSKAREEYGFMLDRYEKLINCERFSDFNLLRADAPLPNLLAWLHITKLSVALDILKAQKGNALESTVHLVRHLKFTKKANNNSRILITNMIAKAASRYSIWALNEIMNLKDCPPSVFDLIYENTQSISPDEFSSKIPYACEASIPARPGPKIYDRILYWFFYHKNRTQNCRLRYAERYVHLEKTPPYQWSTESIVQEPFTTGVFWWLQNPIGKKHLDTFLPNISGSIIKFYLTRTAHDILHIAADLHRNYDPAKTIQSQLNELSSYRELLDPCSGKPYIWNEAKKILYSIGLDRHDNQGDTRDYKFLGGDYVLPIRIPIK